MTIRQLESVAQVADKKAMLKSLDAVDKKFSKLEAALKELKEVSKALPADFKKYIYGGAVHNLDTPTEYNMAIGADSLKDMYAISQSVVKTRALLAKLENDIKAYKPKA